MLFFLSNKKNLMKKILFFGCIVLSQFIFSQDIEKKYKFNFQLDNRFSSIRNNNITLFGAKVGLQYKNLTRFGVGASFILNPVEITNINKRTRLEETNTINFWYISLFNDWILYKKENLECFVTEQIGYGNPVFVRSSGGEIFTDINIPLVVNEISGQVNYKILPWLGAGAGIGYRNLWNGDQRIKNTLEATIYIFKLICYPENIF